MHEPEASDRVVTLRAGNTRVRIEGPHDGTPLLLVHGATVPSWEFDLVLPHLHAARFRTLRFDLYGHGASDCVAAPHSLDLFVQQASDVLDASQFPRPLCALGHSVGAAVVAALASERPGWIERVVLVAPMLDFRASSPGSHAFRLPVLGELLMRGVGLPALVRRRRIRYSRIGQPQLGRRFRAEASYRRLGRTLLSMIRDGALGEQRACYAALGEAGRDVLVVWGERDRVVPAAHVATIRALVPRHVFETIADAEHNILLSHPERVAAAVAAFIREGHGARARH